MKVPYSIAVLVYCLSLSCSQIDRRANPKSEDTSAVTIIREPPEKSEVKEVASPQLRPQEQEGQPLTFRESDIKGTKEILEAVQPQNEARGEEQPLSKSQSEIKDPDEIKPNESLNQPATDHSLWDELLKEHVSAKGKVDYQGIKSNKDHLDQYLAKLSQEPVQSGWTRNEKLAYWINAYNAFTVELIINNLPLESIREIQEPWDKKFIRLGDDSYSLNQIEHEIIRPQFREPRIHFAVVCAAVSCPKLRNEAFQANKLDQQLTDQARYFINESGKNRISPNQIEVSQLFKWYGEDFTGSGTLIDYLNQYSHQKINKDASITFGEYDWSLNN